MKILTKEDREALVFARAAIQHSIKSVRAKFGKRAIINPLSKRAVAVLGRLLREQKPRKAEAKRGGR